MKKVGIASLVVTLIVCGSMPTARAADESSSSGSRSSSSEKASAPASASAPAAPASSGTSSTVTPAAAAPAPAAAAPTAPAPAVAAPAAPAAAAPVSAAAAPTPQISTTEGSISAVDLKAASPSLKVSSAGKVAALVLDPRTTSVWQNGQLGKLEQLKVGQSVRVRHMLRDGKDIAKSIQILPAASAPLAPAMPAANKVPATKAH